LLAGSGRPYGHCPGALFHSWRESERKTKLTFDGLQIAQDFRRCYSRPVLQV
jgi:hypothetical protein